MAKSYENFDKPYRRGLILGLSLAELFLILLFLLLLASIGLTSLVEEQKIIIIEEKKVIQEENNKLRDELNVMKKLLGGEITITELQKLVSDAAMVNKTKEDNERLNKKNKELTDQINAFKDIKKILDEQNIDEKELNELVKNNKEYLDVIAENNKLKDQKKNLNNEIKTLKNELNSQKVMNSILEEKLKNKNEEFIKVSEQLDRLTDKGRAPPCWFVVVDDKTEPTGKRQKDVKIFDIKKDDNGFFVRKHNNEKIKQINYGNRENLPKFNISDFDIKLTKGEFIQKFKRFFDVGNNKMIHPYKCVFMVDVYDATSVNNKIGYKNSLRTIENIFMKYEESGKWKD